MGKNKWLSLLPGFVFALAILAGCSSSGGTEQEPAFTYAMSGQYRPFNYFDENNQLTGFDVEIGRALAEKMGMKPVPIATPWEGLYLTVK